MSSALPNGPSDKAAPLPPPRVPDHELLRRIGRGAYGEVWLARSVTGAFRAVKIVHRRNFEHERPFEREFEGILKFEPVSRKHDSQVDILHVGHGDDCFYYVMELADDQATGGQINPDNYTPRTLKSDLTFRGRLPFEECVSFGIALTTALDHLHANGLVHRDVKPSNIIFVNGLPKLADIGLVTGIDATRSHVGTEGFAAPEGPGSPQADLYSLGKVLYEIATGKDRQEFPELPTQLRELPDREGLVELNAVIARACRHDPKDRYSCAAAMRAELELLQSGKSLARLHRMEQRLRFVTRAGAAVAGLAALIAGGWFYQHSQTREARQLAEQNRQLASEKSRLADEKSRLAEENRARLVRLDIANGARLLDEGDTAGALLWFTEALPLVANNAAEASIHRIRIQQTLNEIPRLLQLLPHESSVLVGVFSPDGRRIATGTEAGRVRVWDASSGEPLWPPREMGLPALQMRFSRDGRRLFVSSSVRQDCAAQGRAPANFAAVLDAETGKEIFPTMSSNVAWATFSSDDRWLAVADFKNVIRIHDASDGRPVAELKGHTRDVLMPSFSVDGSVFASASRDRTARLWRLPSGEPLGPPLQHQAPVARAILSADGRRLVTSTEPLKANGECLIQTWDTPTGEKIGGHLHVTNVAYALFFNDRGDRLFTGGNEPRVRVWNSEEHTEALRPLEMNGVASSWALSPDGARVAVGSDDLAARLWSLETGELLFPPFRHTAWIMSVQFSPDGTRLLTTGNDGTARLWDLNFKHEDAVVRLDAPIIKEPANYFDANLGRQNGPFPVSLSDGSVRLIDAERLQEVHRLVPGGKEQPPDRCVAAPDGKQWAVYRWSRELLQPPQALDLWREEQGELRHFVLQHPQRVQSMAFSPDGARLCTGCNDGHVRIWRTADGVVERTIKLPQVYPYVSAFSPDLRLTLLYFYQTNALEVFDIESGKTVGSRFVVPAMQDWGFDPQGRRTGTVSQDSYARIFDAHTGKLTIAPLKHPDSVFWLDWAADGRRIVTAGDGPQALMFETATGEFLAAPLKTGTQSTRAARWSADGRFVVTRSDDNFARVWDAATAEPITPLLRHAGYIRFACIAANRRLLTGSDPNLLRAWDLTETSLPGEVLADYAKLLSGRRLNATGVLLPLKAEELGELYRSLQKRAPELFK